MLAMNYRGPGRVRASHKPMPEILHPQDAIVRVTRSCICGSDLHLYHGNVPDTRVGTTFGHEFTGVVEEVGAEAAGSAMQTLTGRKTLMQAGSATALQWAINSVKKGGVVSIVGVYGPTGNLVPIGNVLNKGITIRANQTSVKRVLPRLIEHVQNGIINPKEIITHRIPLQEVGDAYRIFSDKLDGCIKPLLIT